MGTSSCATIQSPARGFTLIEMVVTMAMLAILITLAAPSFSGMIATNRATSTANQLLQLLTSARTEAIKSKRLINVCKSADGLSCTTTGGWEQGILTTAVTDTNGDQKVNAGEPSVILRSDVPFMKAVTVSATGSIGNSLVFYPSGNSDVTVGGTFTVIPRGSEGKKNQQRAVVIRFRRLRVDNVT